MKRKYSLAISLCLSLALLAGCNSGPSDETTVPSSEPVETTAPAEQKETTAPTDPKATTEATEPKETKEPVETTAPTEQKETTPATEAPVEDPDEDPEEDGLVISDSYWTDGDMGFYFAPDGVNGQAYSGGYVVDDGTYEWNGYAGRFTTSHTYIYAIRIDEQGNMEVTDEMGEVSILTHELNRPDDNSLLDDDDLALLQSHPWYTSELRLEFREDGICVVEGLNNGSYQEASYTFDDLWEGGVIATEVQVMEYSFVNGVLTVDGEVCYE